MEEKLELNFMKEKPEKTLGEIRVRTEFNASASDEVTLIKHKTAELINLVESLKTKTNCSEKNRLINLAQTSFEEAAMWAVKAATI